MVYRLMSGVDRMEAESIVDALMEAKKATAPKTCRYGHPWTSQTRYRRHNGATYCRVCAKLKAREKKQRMEAA